MSKRCARLCLAGWTMWLGMALLVPTVQAAPLPTGEMQKRAKEFADKGQWADALDLYFRIPKAARDEVAFRQCLRHFLQFHRLRDKPSHALVAQLQLEQVLGTYKDVLGKLKNNHVDHDRFTVADLFHNGVQELRCALEDKEFVREYLTDSVPEAVEAFKTRLDNLRDDSPMLDTSRNIPDQLVGAQDQLQQVLLAAQGIGLKPGVVMLEFICGACHALDEYTLFLSPSQLLDLDAGLNGRLVGIGIEVAFVEHKLVILRVLSYSPAEQLLSPGDSIVRIDGQPIDSRMSSARLLGEERSFVELEVQPVVPPGGTPQKNRTVKVERHSVYLAALGENSGVGYIKLVSFQKNTLQELKDAILQLGAQPGGLKSLVIDLRGNLGGYFPAALDVAQLFLQDGVIVYTQTTLDGEKEHKAKNAQALTLPLVLLVDGETASAAEVVAGALKENGRATLVGQTTFGKCSIQYLVQLKKIHSGIQITMARFSSPKHVGYDGRGVVPDRFVDRDNSMTGDIQRDVAFQVAEQLLKMVPH